jgi:hypothetical protein
MWNASSLRARKRMAGCEIALDVDPNFKTHREALESGAPLLIKPSSRIRAYPSATSTRGLMSPRQAAEKTS